MSYAGGGAKKVRRRIKRERYYARHPEKYRRAAKARGYIV